MTYWQVHQVSCSTTEWELSYLQGFVKIMQYLVSIRFSKTMWVDCENYKNKANRVKEYNDKYVLRLDCISSSSIVLLLILYI